MVELMSNWNKFPDSNTSYLYKGNALLESWLDLHRGDCVEFPDADWVEQVLSEAPDAAPESFDEDFSTLAGIIQDEDYYERLVKPRVDGDRVSYIGPVGPDIRGELLGGARALLHLIDFDEPFGFSVVEAMACGTPVIAYRRGSMPELIRDGENGFLVASVDEAVAAVHAAERIDRVAVRASVEHRFDVSRMADEYLAVYHRVVELHRTGRAGPVDVG